MKAHVIEKESNKILNADTIVHLLVDKSGSMSSIREKTVDAINEYVNSMKADKVDDETLVNLSFFSYSYPFDKKDYRGLSLDTACKVKPLEQFEDIKLEDFVPNGGTPLYDAIGYVSKQIEDICESCKQKPDVLFVIITDGMENSSQEWDRNKIQQLISNKEKQGWTVVYLGANQDAWEVGGGMGLSRSNTMSYNVADIGSTMGSLAEATSTYRSSKFAAKSGNVNCSYTSKDFFDGVNQTNNDSIKEDNIGKMVEETVNEALSSGELEKMAEEAVEETLRELHK